jgi:RNA polymerase sigma factor (sigma-70 family)
LGDAAARSQSPREVSSAVVSDALYPWSFDGGPIRRRAALRTRKSKRAKPSSDRDLILGCREGDVGAWQRLLDRYEQLVFSVPLKHRLSREDAVDITQLTFTILVQAMNTLSEDSSLGAWLTTVARRHTWRLLNRNRREAAGELGSPSEGTPLLANSGTEDMEHLELTEWLNHGLSLVSKPCRNLLYALYLDPEQPSYAEVAARLGMPVGSVGPTRTRCLKCLRQVLGE